MNETVYIIIMSHYKIINIENRRNNENWQQISETIRNKDIIDNNYQQYHMKAKAVKVHVSSSMYLSLSAAQGTIVKARGISNSIS